MDHLASLDNSNHVAQRGDIFDFDGRQVVDAVIELGLVALKGLQRLVSALKQVADFLQLTFFATRVDVDHAHFLAGRDHGHVERSGDALGRSVAGAGLAGRDSGVGDEMYVRSRNSPAFGRNNDGAIHFRQFGQPLRTVRGIDEEPAGADR